jgi:N-methylhydantoinase A
VRIFGVDTGGTFTDLIAREPDGSDTLAKVPSTPDDPARAVLAALGEVGGAGARDHVIHGTTVALNALLTGRVARTALVTNAGFADLIEVGRQERPELYALHPVRVAPLAPRELRFEVDSRRVPAEAGGFEQRAKPSAADLEALAKRLRRARPDSIAVGLLHSYAHPEDERAVADALAALDLPITCSGELLPEHREVERYHTALVNAALVPRVAAYLDHLSRALSGTRLSVLQSMGGSLPAERAGQEPVRVLLSGPAGGVVGARIAAAEAGWPALVALDMGGTSTDVAFARSAGPSDDAAADVRAATELPKVAGYPIGVPCLDLHTIGCGGGSLARVDASGVLRVGPESAGADPGPVCYGHSDVPTVTDAHVQLGHLAGGAFVGGRLELDRDRVATAFEALGRPLNTDADGAARAVLHSARAAMRRALGVMTLQRGADPGQLPLVAFGGAGGLHAAALAGSLGQPAALAPRFPGALSAWGMTRAGAAAERARTVLEPLDRWGSKDLRAAFGELSRAARAEVRAAQAKGRLEEERVLDLRYAGQAYELEVPAGPRPAEAFRRAHERLYGYALEDRPIELVCLRARVRAGLGTGTDAPRPRRRAAPAAARAGTRRAHLGGRWCRATLWRREALRPGHVLEGPAIVEEYSGTTLVPPGWRLQVTAGGHLELRPTP